MSEFPQYYEFFSPVKIVSGLKALDSLPNELGQLLAKRPLLITDQGVVDAGLIRFLKDAFDGSGMDLAAVFDQVPPDSSVDVVREAARAFRENRCDCLIALGGGSPMDTAKGANILLSEDAEDLKDFEGADRLEAPMKPLIAVPTTAGTGSEATSVAVIKDKQKKVKMAFASPLLFPRVAIIDPRTTMTMPPYITAAGGMDALTHAMEACTCLQRNPLSDAYAFAAVELIGNWLVKAVSDRKNTEARVAMANASTMAGIAFSNSMVGTVHALGHATGAVCNIPHGVAMSIFLPFGLEYNLEKTGFFLEKLLLALGGQQEYAKVDAKRRASRVLVLVKRLRQTLFELCGLPTSLRGAGVKEKSLEKIAERAINDGSVVFAPVELDYQDALNLLHEAF